MKVVIDALARADVKRIQHYYRSTQVPKLDRRFTAALETTLRQVAAHPEAFSIRYRNVRKAHLDVFPYGVFYNIESNCVRILAVIADAQNAADQDSLEL